MAIRNVDKKKSVEQVAVFLKSPVSLITGRPAKEGNLFGLELELEGRNVAMGRKAVKGWTQHEEGSLRNESTEYVFSKPADYNESCERVNRLFDEFDKNTVILKDSYRTSTHVHLNFSDKTPEKVLNFIVLHTVLEGLLEHFCGESRKGNLFCLSFRDAEETMNVVEDSFTKYLNFGSFTNERRYCALNISAINKFGSIEIRTMRGASKAEDVLNWLSILKQMYEFACNKMKTPRTLIESLSMFGARGWIENVFDKPTAQMLIDSWDEKNGTLHASLYEGARLVQYLSYQVDEAYHTEVKIPEAKAPKAPPGDLIHPDLWPYIHQIVRGGRNDDRRLLVYPAQWSPDRQVPEGAGWSALMTGAQPGANIQGIAPQVITYDSSQGCWIESTDMYGNPCFQLWHWGDREWLIQTAQEQFDEAMRAEEEEDHWEDEEERDNF